MKILFLSRAHPPVIGGIERQNYEIGRSLGERCHLIPIVNMKGKKYLLFYFFRSLFSAWKYRKQYDYILLGDGVLAISSWIIKLFVSVPVFCIVHGLDLTYDGLIYRTFWKRLFFKSVDHFIAVSNETIRQGVRLGLDSDKFTYIPNGVDVNEVSPVCEKKELFAMLGEELSGPVLLTLGRLVKRKGVCWFIKNVLPKLNPNVTYLIAGDGPEKDAINLAIEELDLSSRVKYLGLVSKKEKQILMSTADIFVQPNIPVEGDMEGFGLVVLEAALARTVVVASSIEGLKDAISDGKTGFLLEPLNSKAYTEKLTYLLLKSDLRKAFGDSARELICMESSWGGIADRYIELFSRVSK